MDYILIVRVRRPRKASTANRMPTRPGAVAAASAGRAGGALEGKTRLAAVVPIDVQRGNRGRILCSGGGRVELFDPREFFEAAQAKELQEPPSRPVEDWTTKRIVPSR